MWADQRLATVEQREKPLPWQQLGLTYTATGYGHIPTRHMVKTEHDGPWRRVWSYSISNVGTYYVKIKGKRHIVAL